MENILLVTNRKDHWADLANIIGSSGETKLSWVKNGEQALSIVKDNSVDLIVADEELEDMSGLEFIRKLLFVNALVNTSVVSSLTEEDFHEASEGLGILARLSPNLDRTDAEELLRRTKAVKNLVFGSKQS